MALLNIRKIRAEQLRERRRSRVQSRWSLCITEDEPHPLIWRQGAPELDVVWFFYKIKEGDARPHASRHVADQSLAGSRTPCPEATVRRRAAEEGPAARENESGQGPRPRAKGARAGKRKNTGGETAA